MSINIVSLTTTAVVATAAVVVVADVHSNLDRDLSDDTENALGAENELVNVGAR